MLGRLCRVVVSVENRDLKGTCDGEGGRFGGNKLVKQNKDARHNCLGFTQPASIHMVRTENKEEDKIIEECSMVAL
jgi:hypothetical protein